MTTPATNNTSDVWHLDSTTAVLCTPLLTARVNLLDPRVGLSQLVFKDATIIGTVLGVSPGSNGGPSKNDLSDVFVRGNDLVATYAETDDRPFSLQVYWRVSSGEQGSLLLDTILSLQTDLLESFPGVAVETTLSATSAWFLSENETAVTELSFTANTPIALPTDRADSLLLRSEGRHWSYAETTHPKDRGDSQIVRANDEEFQLQRQLGGRFLEKGVIRRLRVRGVFLPRENDEKLARQSFASLATDQPPLTT